eukprot:m.31667 g.31667  ORF g.31667 m.31667 type:complete len:167 (+) comp31526_c0_seq2:513-1013(+)
MGSDACVSGPNMFLLNSRVHRITVIQKVLIEQLKILETLTPLDFMNFRDKLDESSGFESVQFRLIECKLGIKESQRKTIEAWHDDGRKKTFKSTFDTYVMPEKNQKKRDAEGKLKPDKKHPKDDLNEAINSKSLFELVDVDKIYCIATFVCCNVFSIAVACSNKWH